MEKTFNIDIVTPEKKVFEGEAVSIAAPGIEGEFGVLRGHAPFATVLAPGVVTLKYYGGKEELMAVSGGYIEVTPGKVILLVETADRPGEVDVEKIKRSQKEKENLLKARDRKDVDYDAMQAELFKEMSRLKAVEMLRKRKKV